MTDQTEAPPVVYCKNPSCTKIATLTCPTCIKLNISGSTYCSQECFKLSWDMHKQSHKPKISPSSLPKEFNLYNFSGTLRPWQKSPKKTVPDHIQRPDYANHPKGVSMDEKNDKNSDAKIKIYTPEEIEKIKYVCRMGREILDIAGLAVKVGITTDEIDTIVHEETIKRNAYPSPLNYFLFPKSVCTSVNEIICHGIPDYRPLEDGDIVNIDISVYYNGYHSDLNETFFVGAVDAESLNVVECAYESLSAAVNMVKPGTLYRDVGFEINSVALKYKCSVNQTYCGHGIGSLFHTSPNIPHYANNRAQGIMEVGHIFTIEPMINCGHHKDKTWPDNWTASTIDGKKSSQFEHTMIVTQTGCELLTGKVGFSNNKMPVWNREMFQR